MGITKGSKTTFSNDVLKLELSGPAREHLSIIDVPGIFRKKSEGKTTDEDMKLVRSMVESYMENPRSVMLAVVPANADIATQEITEMAAKYDAKGIRTLGILTKPDLVDPGAEQPIIEIVEGKREKLLLGWHVVRNFGAIELGDPNLDRKKFEMKFFETRDPWNRLEPDRVGVKTLQSRLQEVLTDHVRREFPGESGTDILIRRLADHFLAVRAELNKRLRDKRKRLDALGLNRETSSEQSHYLMELAVKYQEVLTQALNTTYATNDLFEQNPELKLATRFVTRNDQFAEDMRRKGHYYTFVRGNQGAQDEDDDDDDGEAAATEPSAIPGGILGRSEDGTGTKVRKETTPPDLEEHLHEHARCH